MAVTVEDYSPQQDRTVADQRFAIRDDLVNAEIVFGGDLAQIRQSGDAEVASVYVAGAHGTGEIRVHMALQDFYTFRHSLERLIGRGGVGDRRVDGSSGNELTIDVVGDGRTSSEAMAPTQIRVSLRREAPASEVAITLDRSDAIDLNSSMRVMSKVFQWATWGGYDQPEGWSLGPMGSWTAVDTGSSKAISGTIRAQATLESPRPNDPVDPVPRGPEDMPGPVTFNRRRAGAFRAVMTITIGAVEAGIVLLALFNLGAIATWLEGLPLVGGLFDLPGVGVIVAVAVSVLALNIVALVGSAVLMAAYLLMVLVGRAIHREGRP